MINFFQTKKNLIVKVLFLLILFIGLLYLFRGAYNYGMNMDEITRANNLVAYFNSNAYPQNQGLYNINLFGHAIPLMQREYISTAMLLPYLPLFLFDDPLIGIRTMYFVYFFISLSVFFLILSKFNIRLSILTTLMIASSPIFFPEITIGFAWSLHILLITPGIYLLYLYFTNPETKKNNLWYLFFGIFLISLAVNISFYNVWILTALFLISTVFFIKQWGMIFSSWSKILVALSAFVLGLLNFVIYNIDNKLATFKPLYKRIFDLENYNKTPINYTESLPLADDIENKISIFLHGVVGANYYLYLFLAVIVLILYFIIFGKIWTKGIISKNRYYFIPILATLLITVFIFVSPNAYRPGHFVHLIPFFSLTVICLFLLYHKFYPKLNNIWMILLIFMISLNIFTTKEIMVEANTTNGEGYFSPAIFELNDYYNKHNISDKDTVYLQWGMYSQMYFLNKGEYKINSLVFQLVTKENEAQKEIIRKYLISFVSEGEKIYFPIYDCNDKLWEPNANAFFDLMNEYNIDVNEEKVFYEKNGKKVFTLYSINNLSEIKNILDDSN